MLHPATGRRLGVSSFVLGLALVLTSAAATAQGKVWVVDANGLPGFDFTDVQPAVNAAASGDVVLVRGRFGKQYGGFTVRNKSLTIAGEPDSSTPLLTFDPPVVGPIRVRDIAAGQSVVLRGLVSDVAAPSAAPSLLVENALGRVFVEESFLGRSGSPTAMASVPPALQVSGSNALVLVHSAVFGQEGQVGTASGDGAAFSSSRVFLHDTTVDGGAGADAVFTGPGVVAQATSGGLGASTAGGLLFATGVGLRGGTGGAGFEDAILHCHPPGDGGTGLVMVAAALVPDVVLLDAQLAGGAGGDPGGVNCPPAQDGLALFQLAGTVQTVGGNARSLVTTSPVRESETGLLQFQGQAGDLVFLLIGAPGAPLLSPGFDGALHLGAIGATLFLGAIGGAGPLELAFTVQELGPGVDAAVLHLQPAYLKGTVGGFALGDPSTMLLLDRSF